MLNATSHEFRNPLAGIINILSSLDSEQFTSDQVQLIKVAKSSADLLLFLANDMMDLAQIEAGKLRLVFESFNVVEVLEEIVYLLGFKAQNKGIQLKYTENLSLKFIRSDVNRFK